MLQPLELFILPIFIYLQFFLYVNFKENVLNLSPCNVFTRSGRSVALFPRLCSSSRRPAHPSLNCQYLGETFSALNGIWGNFSPRYSPSPPSSFISARPALNSLTRPFTFVRLISAAFRFLWDHYYCYISILLLSILYAIYHNVQVCLHLFFFARFCFIFFYKDNKNIIIVNNNNSLMIIIITDFIN